MNRSRLAVFLLTMLAGVELHAGGSLPDRKAPDFDVAAPLWESGQYAYDGAGNIITIGDDAFDYDLAGRVTAGTAHTKTHANSQTFEYDVYGNLKIIQTKSGLRPATNAAWVARQLTIDSATNRVLKPCGPAAGCSNLGYDPAGNVTSDGPATSSWDLLGNMQQLTTAGRKERYLYDASNERIATITVDTATHEYRRYTIRGANQKVLREATDEVTGSVHSWKWDKDYVHRDGALIASIVPTDATATVEETSHFHLDHLGSARVTTDANGYRRSMNTYYPFGEEAPGSDFNRERIRFTGHERDFGATPAEDLDYMHARYYRAVWGRFTAVDRVLGSPSDVQSWNRYAYADNNPILLVDPDGNSPKNALKSRLFDLAVSLLLDPKGTKERFIAKHFSKTRAEMAAQEPFVNAGVSITAQYKRNQSGASVSLELSVKESTGTAKVSGSVRTGLASGSVSGSVVVKRNELDVDVSGEKKTGVAVEPLEGKNGLQTGTPTIDIDPISLMVANFYYAPRIMMALKHEATALVEDVVGDAKTAETTPTDKCDASKGGLCPQR